MARGDAEPKGLSQVLAALWKEGVQLDWVAAYTGRQARRVALPTYPFERKLHWVEPPAPEAQSRFSTSASQPGQIPPIEIAMTPASPASSLPDSTALAAPRLDRLKTAIAAIFTDLSGIETTTAEYEHQFLELGFDSLFLTQATQSLNRAFGVKLTFRQVMEQYSTIASLAAHLDEALPLDRFAAAAPPIAVSTSQPLPALVLPVSGQGIERLLADQLAAMSEMFAQQVATLRAAAGLANLQQSPAQVAPPIQQPRPAVQPVSNAEVKHGSFRPMQAKTQHELDDDQKHYIATLIARYVALTPTSKRMTQDARKHLADPRAVAGFRPQWKEMVYPLVTDRAKGSRLWDVDGNEYIDIVNGYGCIMFGHSPEFVVEAAQKQLARGVAIGPQSALAGEVAALICELTGNERATFLQHRLRSSDGCNPCGADRYRT